MQGDCSRRLTAYSGFSSTGSPIDDDASDMPELSHQASPVRTDPDVAKEAIDTRNL